jgi:hypothetical protein
MRSSIEAQSCASVPPCAGLDVDEAVVRVGRVAEHAAELHRRDFLLDAFEVALDGHDRRFVILAAREFEQLARVGDVSRRVLQRDHHAFEGFLFLAQFLGMFGVVPDRRVFQRARDFLELFGLQVEVKDTSAARVPGSSGRPGGRRWR